MTTIEHLPDGEYLTTPLYGNPSTTRRIRVVNSVVHIGGHFFTLTDFFRVNTMVRAELRPQSTQALHTECR